MENHSKKKKMNKTRKKKIENIYKKCQDERKEM